MDYSFLKPKKKFDYSFLSKKTSQEKQISQTTKGEIVTRTLSPDLGGGTYKMEVGNPNANIKTSREDYGGLPTKEGYERADIFPVSLSGVNASSTNIAYEKNLPEFDSGKDKTYRTATDKYLMTEILPKYKAGKISLREAQVLATSYLRNELTGLNKAMENQNLGGKAGELADKIVGFFKGQKQEKKQPMVFKVGEGLNEEDKKIAEKIISYEISKGEEEQTKKPLETQVYENITYPFTKSGRNEAAQRGVKSEFEYNAQAEALSKVLNKKVEPYQYNEEIKKASPEEKNAVRALVSEKQTESLAKIGTAPFRFTAGSLGTAVTSYALEKADSNLKYTPKTDAEKLIIGENDIQRLTKQEDLYGTIARGAGIPVALLAIAVIENPFLRGTGTSKLIKGTLEKQIAKLGEKQLSKIGTNEIIRIADETIKTEKLAGKITEQEAKKASEAVNGLRVKPVEPQIKPQEPRGEVLAPKTTKPLAPSKKPILELLEQEAKKYKSAEEFVKKEMFNPMSKYEWHLSDNPNLIEGKLMSEQITPKNIGSRGFAGMEENIGQVFSTKSPQWWYQQLAFENRGKGPKNIYLVEVKNPSKPEIMEEMAQQSISQPSEIRVIKKAGGVNEIENPYLLDDVKKSQLQDIWNKANKQISKPLVPSETAKIEPSVVKKEAVEAIRKKIAYNIEPDTKTKLLLKENKVGVEELPFDSNGNITLYREGPILPGKLTSYSLESKWEGQKPYIINKKDIVINTNSQKLNDLYNKTYRKPEELSANISALDKFKSLEGEVMVIQPKTETPLVKQTIKYIPEEKPVDLRKKITTKPLIAKSSVPNRIQDSAISKGLKETFGETFEHDIITFEDQAKKVGQILDEDPEKAIRIALGQETPTNGALPESVLMAVVKQAEKKGDIELLRKLATEEKGVAQEASLLGARIKMYDQQLEDNAFKNIKDVVENRKKSFKGNLKEIKNKEVVKIKEEIKKVKPKKDEWLEFISSITC